jgi:hypothetical protein
VIRLARHRLAANLLPVPLRLLDGATVWLRPVVPEDGNAVLGHRGRSSNETLYQRFFRSGQPSRRDLAYLADADYVDHFAWVALDEAGVPVGEASYFRAPDGTTPRSASCWGRLPGTGSGDTARGRARGRGPQERCRAVRSRCPRRERTSAGHARARRSPVDTGAVRRGARRGRRAGSEPLGDPRRGPRLSRPWWTRSSCVAADERRPAPSVVRDPTDSVVEKAFRDSGAHGVPGSDGSLKASVT